MCVLNDKNIREYCEKYSIVEPCDKERIRPSSYDLSVGDEYRFSHEEKTRKVGKLGRRIKISPYSICYILTREKLNLCNDVSAIIYPRHRLVKEGILMYPQPPIDPGYKGKLYVLLHNLTGEDRIIEKGEHIASIVFHKLVEKAERPYGSNKEADKYQGVETFEKLGLTTQTGFEPYTSALGRISKKVAEWREGLLSKWIPILFILMTVLLMVLTIMFAWRN